MTAASAAVMGHPAASVAWLANQLAADGEGLKAGQLVFSGGVTAPVPVGRRQCHLRVRQAWGPSR
jgi:2-oxo-3-hexenedioate decarboxylase